MRGERTSCGEIAKNKILNFSVFQMAAGAAMELWRFDGTTTRHRVRHAPAIHPNPTYPKFANSIFSFAKILNKA